jgi:hypothetical protein
MQHIFRDRPKVSKTFGTGDPAGIALRDAGHWESLGVEFKLGTVSDFFCCKCVASSVQWLTVVYTGRDLRGRKG